ncbi:MmcB family DNA repair protein [Pseudovibrio sp. SPO723]|uniref:MmcB family DNA repair protein n=1 Tax=Nesiotobacter zosterae TaxID=392721 RepID=UPI0029C156E9|nr:MmcB family DNA repair protein [Pseudovibrio sp. SPO723]MDX5595060.1 MmcB family DNA repair protein [Pseudovibrio sp. SPO723]
MLPSDSSNRIRLDDPLKDGRQSERALRIQRGTMRFLRTIGFSSLAELPLASGRRADLCALGPKGALWIVEIKSSIADFKSDTKWPEYIAHCDQFYFATSVDVPQHIFPENTGLIISDGYGAEIIRPAPEVKLAAATRKSVTQRFAEVAARRLHTLMDPDQELC